MSAFFIGDLDRPTDDPLSHRTFPKPESRKRTKGRKKRKEAKVQQWVRAECVKRDGVCRAAGLGQDHLYEWHGLECQGSSEWAHMHVKRRSQTRGQDPEIRHTRKDSLMLCRFHHQEYDAHRLKIACLTRNGADGKLKFTRAK